jgi:uncharacterized phage protein (TIGR01671 family)
MRDIKYKAYLHDEKEIVDVIEINFEEKIIRYYDTTYCKDDAEKFELFRSGPNADCPFEHCNLMQYTGRELMGEEVYEGYILEEYISGERYQVVWDDYGMFLYCDVNGNEGIDYYEFEDTVSLDFTEVIGNIYENPELLESEDNQ